MVFVDPDVAQEARRLGGNMIPTVTYREPEAMQRQNIAQLAARLGLRMWPMLGLGLDFGLELVMEPLDGVWGSHRSTRNSR